MVKNLDEVGAYLCQSDRCYPFDEHYHAPVALSLDFYKVAFGAIKDSSVDAYFSAFGNVYFVGTKVGDIVITGFCYGYELLHLMVWNDDWDVLAINGAGVELQEIDSLFDGFD